MDAQSVNLSKVKILKAVSPSIFLGIDVVPPVPKIVRIVIDRPKNR